MDDEDQLCESFYIGSAHIDLYDFNLTKKELKKLKKKKKPPIGFESPYEYNNRKTR